MTRFQRWFLYSTTAAATLSGVVYFLIRRFMEPVDPWAVINHPLEPWALKVHILTAPAMLFAIGLITTQHIWRALKSKLPTARRTGLVAAYAFVPLAVSGYLIQVVTAPLGLEVLAWTHLALGLACAAAIFGHRYVVHARRLPGRGRSLPVLKMAGPTPAKTPERPARGRNAEHGTEDREVEAPLSVR